MASRQEAKVTRLDLRIPNDIYSQVEEIAKANNEPTHHITGNIILTPTLIKLIRLGIRSLSDNYPSLLDLPTFSERVPDTLTLRMDTNAHRLTVVEEELSELKKLVISLSDNMSDNISDKIVNISSNPDVTRAEAINLDNISDIVSDTIVSLEEVEQAIETEPSKITIEASPPNLTKADISELKSQLQNIEIENIDSDRPKPLSIFEDESNEIPAAISDIESSDPVGITIAKLVKITGKTRQGIDKLRKNGRLNTLGYDCRKVDRFWSYYPVTTDSKSL
jgi:hypothetical protein